MSWDIFVQDIPADAKCVADIPDDFIPRPIGSASEILGAIRSCAPFADYSDPTCVRMEHPEIELEISIRPEQVLHSFAFHIRGGEQSAALVAEILRALHLRALDPASESGIFDALRAAEGFQKWQLYRDRVVSSPNGSTRLDEYSAL